MQPEISNRLWISSRYHVVPGKVLSHWARGQRPTRYTAAISRRYADLDPSDSAAASYSYYRIAALPRTTRPCAPRHAGRKRAAEAGDEDRSFSTLEEPPGRTSRTPCDRRPQTNSGALGWACLDRRPENRSPGRSMKRPRLTDLTDKGAVRDGGELSSAPWLMKPHSTRFDLSYNGVDSERGPTSR